MGKKEVIHTVSDNIAALMMIVNNPRVKHVMGNDKKLTIGRTIALTRPNTTETINKPMMVSLVPTVPESEAMSMPGKIHRATQNDAAVTRVRRR